MKHILSIDGIRNFHNIHTRHSTLTSTGPAHHRWPRLKETEELQVKEKKLAPHIRRIWR